ncbi:flavodoxin family protein [Chloroflexota bacterium]
MSMKVLGIVCSPRKGGNTEILVNAALDAARKAGAETQLFLAADTKIAPCDGCETCRTSGICRIKDDMKDLYRQLEEADGVIFGTPVYFMNVTAQAKAIMDRTHAILRDAKLRGKVAAPIVIARRVGAGQVLGLLYSFFTGHRMVISGGGIGYGREKGEVTEGVGGSHNLSALEEARAIGRNVVRMVERLAK